MATQIFQLADVVSKLDTQYEKLPSQPMSNVRNVSANSFMTCMENSPLSIDEPAVEPVEDVITIKAEENKTCSSRKHGVRFDPPLNFHSYVPVASFPSRLAIVKEVARKDKVKSI